MIWRAHLGYTRDIVLWKGVLAGSNDCGGGQCAIQVSVGRLGDVGM
jgi:hypothetical protein